MPNRHGGGRGGGNGFRRAEAQFARGDGIDVEVDGVARFDLDARGSEIEDEVDPFLADLGVDVEEAAARVFDEGSGVGSELADLGP